MMVLVRRLWDYGEVSTGGGLVCQGANRNSEAASKANLMRRTTTKILGLHDGKLMSSRPRIHLTNSSPRLVFQISESCLLAVEQRRRNGGIHVLQYVAASLVCYPANVC